MYSKIFGLSLAVFAFAVVAPSFVLAQTTSTTGLLTVYVQVTNQSGFSYSPGNFTVSVAGQNPSPSSFAGSQSGTLVSLNPGSFVVTVTNPNGYSASYSTGCDNTIAAGQTHTCVITLSGMGGNLFPVAPYTSQYPYTYTPPALSCRTETPTVALGQSARFSAVGGVGGTYNWYATGRNFPNIGPVLTTTFDSSGSHSVTVVNAAQTATCPITVTTSYYPQPVSYTNPSYPYQPSPATPGYTYPTKPTYPTTSYVAPRWPNTGVEPLGAAQVALAVMLLMGAGIVLYPYARKVFALAVR